VGAKLLIYELLEFHSKIGEIDFDFQPEQFNLEHILKNLHPMSSNLLF
jgi:hypothetical protein